MSRAISESSFPILPSDMAAAMGAAFQSLAGTFYKPREGEPQAAMARTEGDRPAVRRETDVLSNNILFIAFEGGRWGAARLVRPLSQAGLNVAGLCQGENPIANTRFLAKHFELPHSRSSRRLEASLADAMRAWRPSLVMPCDEQAVAWLQTLVRRGPGKGRSSLDVRMLQTVQRSLGRPEQFDAMLLKTHTLQLAAKLGVRVPAGGTVGPQDDACAIAAEIGYPLYLKTSFSWSGKGVRLCRTAAEVGEAIMDARPGKTHGIKKVLKRLANRDWFPTDTAIDLQQAISGKPAMYCAVALEGRMLAGFGGIAMRNLYENGPSSVVRLIEHEEMAEASRKLIEATGASGFIGFDFMVDDVDGRAYLLECNPRPIQIGHWGERVGVNLCAALAAALRGQAPGPRQVARDLTVALFPQEWLRDPSGIKTLDIPIDPPWDDPALLRLMMNAAPPPQP